MATLGRSNEIDVFIQKLIEQTYKKFELLIVDQNTDDRVFVIYKKYADKIDIKYFKSGKKGLSISRNIGLEHCNGTIIAFPDDDCEYNNDTLEKAASFFADHAEYNFYTCNTVDKKINRSDHHGKKTDGEVSLFNFRKTGISFTIFVRAECLLNFKFDERFGLGAEYGSAEESDLLIYLIKSKNKGFYFAGVYIYHPFKEIDVKRAYSYGKGLGALYKKAVKVYGFNFIYFIFLFTLFKNIIAICFSPSRKAKIAALKGRLYGFRHYTAPIKET
jgi:glycosyltransferase involved in cell wall biosynthesis